jgi:RNA polymerase sigma-70 factor, ECF subfamily
MASPSSPRAYSGVTRSCPARPSQGQVVPLALSSDIDKREHMTAPSQREFKAMYANHFDAVSRYCLRRLPPDDAVDAVADVFLVAWRRADSWPTSEDETLPWLYGVARNIVRNAQRSSRRIRRLRARMNAEPLYPEPGADNQLVRNQPDAELVEALNSLRPDDQEVLRLRAQEGLTASQISLVLGCSEAAAKKRVSRALARLRKAMDLDSAASLNSPRAIQEGGGR